MTQFWHNFYQWLQTPQQSGRGQFVEYIFGPVITNAVALAAMLFAVGYFVVPAIHQILSGKNDRHD
jgi:hypothetical protein